LFGTVLTPSLVLKKSGVQPAGAQPPELSAYSFLSFGDVHEREQIAADAGVVLRRHVEHRAGRDGGVDGVAAPPQDLQPRFSGKWIARRDDAVACEDLRASLREPALRARSRHGLDRSARLRLLGRRHAERVGD
jgi:hypothetical protein